MPHPAAVLSPLRNSTTLTEPRDLAIEQARHFGIDIDSDYGTALVNLATTLYECNLSTMDLCRITSEHLSAIDPKDRVAWFNAKRFISFQLAKLLHTLQGPLRQTYQSLVNRDEGATCKGAYPLFDNVAAVFSANPVITRTATYLFACTEWVEDAFTGREPLHQIYSRLLNPTSISLANHIVDIECGLSASDYMAWNFNSGLAAVDAILSHLLGYQDVLIVARNVYGGTYQLINDWYGKRANLSIGVVWVDGFEAQDFEAAMTAAEKKYSARLAKGRRLYVYLESPCNPHGYVLDVPGICDSAHRRGWRVIADTTLGTPYLCPVLRAENPSERPDFVVHSYTKELAGSGTTTAGCVIGRSEDMFLPKNHSVTVRGGDGRRRTVSWSETLFWNVFYIKGAFLDADKAFEVLNGMKTLEVRLIQKAINTLTIARALDMHERINVSCPALPSNPNHGQFKNNMRLGLPAGLFTFDLQSTQGESQISTANFKRFFDLLEPAAGMQVSLGQNNTVALCPALTSHSELSSEALAAAGIHPTTIRLAVGLEDPREFLTQFRRAAEIALLPEDPKFIDDFPTDSSIDEIYQDAYREVHLKFIDSKRRTIEPDDTKQ